MKFPFQYLVDQRVDQTFDQRLAKSHLLRQYLDAALKPGQYKIYCPATAFDPSTQSVT